MNKTDMDKNNQLDFEQLAGNSELEHLYDEVQILEESALQDEERLRAAVPALLSWFSGHARILPWREEPTPYRVWVSEIMLQQTRVEAVKPYFERFIGELPGIAALALAEEDRLLKLWEGLGYYSRVRNLAKGAKQVMAEHGGELPADYQKLLKLPGIGSYTAGAISSIAFGLKVPAVDGNVLRVISRVIASREDISEQSTKKWMEILLEKVMPEGAPGDFNQALMEVGATVCIPRGEPLCGECPFYTLCLSRRDGLTGEIPVKKAAKARRIEERTVLLIWDGTRVAVQKRPEKGLLAGLYQFPNTNGWLDEDEAVRAAKKLLAVETSGEENMLPVKKMGAVEDIGESPKMRGMIDNCEVTSVGEAVHVFSHVEWRMKGYLIQIPGGFVKEQIRENGGDTSAESVIVMADSEDLKYKYAIPNAFRAYTAKIAELMGRHRNK